MRRLKNWKLEFPDDLRGEFAKKNHYPSIKELYCALGNGSLDVNVIKTFIIEHDHREAEAIEAAKAASAEKESERPKWEAKQNDGGDDILVINAKNLKGLDYKMAKCCNPVFGDDVFGFVTRDAGIKIHRISCPNASRLIEMYPYRIQKVKWAETPSSGSFQSTIRVITDMEPHVVNQIMDIIGTFKASLRSFNVTENNRTGTYDITMKVSVPSNMELDKVTSQIRNLRSTHKVTRQ